MGALRLEHEVLDAQLIDRHCKKIGRVDELVLELRDGAAPRVAAVLVGGPARARRIGRPMVWLSHLLRAVGRVHRPGVSRVTFDRMRRLDECLQLDVEGDALEAMRVERWLADHVIRHIPGASGKKEKK